MSTDVMEASTEAEFLTTMAENLTEIAGNIIENITENAVTITTMTTMAAVETIMTERMDVVSEVSILATTTGPSIIIGDAMKEIMTNETSTEQPDEMTLKDLQGSVDTFFLIINSFIIFFLQGGFAFLEAGSVRSKNTTNILIKNLLDILLACLGFWVVGYMFFNSEGNAFIGFDPNYICSLNLEATMFAHWFWSFVFCATAATIVSGAVAERCELTAYFVYSIVISGLVYPVVAHWAWTEQGWLNANQYIDFAGSGVVHHLGGVCGFVGAVFLGPRIGRFDSKGKPVTIPGHSVPMAALGAFILLFGFFAFNGSTQGKISSPDDMKIVQRAVMNTMIGGCSSGLSTLLFFRFKKGGKWSLLSTINGTLCGMISTCAFCDRADPHITFIVGIFAAFVYTFIHYLMIWLKIDDPLDAVAVHSGGGMLGVLVTPLVISSGGVFDSENEVTAMHQMWSQLVGILVITAWSATVSSIMFYLLKLNNILRVTAEMEEMGMDIIKHGEAAYPAEAWRELQYRNDDENLPPNMRTYGRMINDEKESLELIKVPAIDDEKRTSQNKMIGTWSKLNKELKKQMMNIENYADSEVVLTVKPLGFRKLSSDTRLVSESDSDTTDGYMENKKETMGGFTNDAFEDDDHVEYANTKHADSGKPFKETHFGGGWNNISSELKQRFENADSEAAPAVITEAGADAIVTDKLTDEESEKEFHSSTLKLDTQESDEFTNTDESIYEQVPEKDVTHPLATGPMQRLIETNDENTSLDFKFTNADQCIYEQLPEKDVTHPLAAGPMQRLIETNDANTSLDFNNSKESSMI